MNSKVSMLVVLLSVGHIYAADNSQPSTSTASMSAPAQQVQAPVAKSSGLWDKTKLGLKIGVASYFVARMITAQCKPGSKSNALVRLAVAGAAAYQSRIDRIFGFNAHASRLSARVGSLDDQVTRLELATYGRAMVPGVGYVPAAGGVKETLLSNPSARVLYEGGLWRGLLLAASGQ